MSPKSIQLAYNLALLPDRRNEVHMNEAQLCLQWYIFFKCIWKMFVAFIFLKEEISKRLS